MLDTDTHCLIMQFLHWDELFRSKQVSKKWSQLLIKTCFRPTTLHDMPGFAMIYGWIYSHRKTVKQGKMKLEKSNIKEIWTDYFSSKMNASINRTYFYQLFKQLNELDMTKMSMQSQILLYKSKFLTNLNLEYLIVNCWLISFRLSFMRNTWFCPVVRLTVITPMPYPDLFDHYLGGECKELKIICVGKTGVTPRIPLRRISNKETVIATAYQFISFPTSPLWYEACKLLYLKDSLCVYKRNSTTEPFQTYPRVEKPLQQQQQQLITNKREADTVAVDEQSNKKKQKV